LKDPETIGYDTKHESVSDRGKEDHEPDEQKLGLLRREAARGIFAGRNKRQSLLRYSNVFVAWLNRRG
jgi:hypothetical protein